MFQDFLSSTRRGFEADSCSLCCLVNRWPVSGISGLYPLGANSAPYPSGVNQSVCRHCPLSSGGTILSLRAISLVWVFLKHYESTQTLKTISVYFHIHSFDFRTEGIENFRHVNSTSTVYWQNIELTSFRSLKYLLMAVSPFTKKVVLLSIEISRTYGPFSWIAKIVLRAHLPQLILWVCLPTPCGVLFHPPIFLVINTHLDGTHPQFVVSGLSDV